MKTYSELIEAAKQALIDNDDLFTDMIDELDNWNGFADGFRAYDMGELDDLHCGMKLSEFLEKVTSDFDLRDDYFYYSVYGLESTDSKVALYRENVDEGELLDNILDNFDNIYFSDSDFEELIESIKSYSTLENAA